MREALGRRKYYREVAERTAVPGVATGLAATATGGDVLFIEATSHRDGDAFVLTGQLGDVMKESAQIALSSVRSLATKLGIDEELFEKRSFHVHVPAGAIPKDGPSAGITMATAIASLLTGRPVKHTVGMTGEITLQGRVLPIGGLKQKVLAAHAAGITDIVIPERNRADLDGHPGERPRRDRVPPGDVDRRGAGPGARGTSGAARCLGVDGASRFPRTSAARRTSSSDATRSRSSTRRTTAARASRNSGTRWGGSRRRHWPSGSASSSVQACFDARCATRVHRTWSTC